MGACLYSILKNGVNDSIHITVSFPHLFHLSRMTKKGAVFRVFIIMRDVLLSDICDSAACVNAVLHDRPSSAQTRCGFQTSSWPLSYLPPALRAAPKTYPRGRREALKWAARETGPGRAPSASRALRRESRDRPGTSTLAARTGRDSSTVARLAS